MDEAFSVVSVLADEIHAAWCDKDGGVRLEAVFVHGTKDIWIVHIRQPLIELDSSKNQQLR
jgi:hypothetical protein